jgi:hypothetical protein
VRPGDTVQFTLVSPDDARVALRRREDELSAIEDGGAEPDDGLGWAGSLR